MQDNNVKPPQFSVILRILGGGYLVYLAYDLLTGIESPNTLIMAAAVVFGVVGAVLVFFSIRHLVRHEYFYDAPKSDCSEEESEDQSE